MEASAQPLTAPRTGRTQQTVHAGLLTGLVVQLLLLAGLAGTVGLDAAGWLVGLACAATVDAALAHGLSRYRSDRLKAADSVTLARASLAVGVAALVADSWGHRASVTLLVSLSALALALDFVDGWVARRTRTTTLGARFDAEVDAFLILVLSVYVARSAGVWVLAIGAARYAFLAAGWLLPWMRQPLPVRYWGKVVAATQGIVLTVAAAGVLSPAVQAAVLVAALVLLAESFGRNVGWLWVNRRIVGGVTGAVGASALERGRARATTMTVLTALAVLIVWAALVAPNQPQDATLTAFFRIPLEGLLLVALAAVLPTTPRRILAGVAGPVLALLVILKILDIAFFSLFARPFDILGDVGDAGIGIETMRGALGRSEANLIVYGGVALAVALVVVVSVAMFRLTKVAARNRRWSLRTAGALGSIWLVCSVFGVEFLPHVPVASTATAGYVVHQVHAVQADIRDEAVFANQIKHDAFRNTAGTRLLTGLRGDDVLLVFVESYGQVSVQGSSFSPAIDSLLTGGTKQLQTAGFSARSAFVNAPGFGGISWLAHSTMQSGVWANSQRRYDQLVAGHRFTLSEAFNRAGWRTINFAPADDRGWAEGSAYYHYRKLYDRRGMGYHGPTYNYAPMPDQYMFAALQRLELAKAHRQPLFAEVDTVSSHMPWDRIPPRVPWNTVGNGSIFNHRPAITQPNSFWWHPNEVKAAYAQSLEYSLNTLISFVRHYGKKNLVMIVVGDEQPLAIVSGQHTSHEVPISIIAHDPSVLKRIGAWEWQSGLLPSPKAPVWPMSAFRDHFLTAFGPHGCARKAWACVRFGAPAAVLAVLIWRLGTGPFVHGLSRVNGAALAQAAGLVALTTVLCAWRWKIVARGLGVDLSLRTAVAAYYRALFLNVALPGGIVGDVHRGISQGRDVNSVGTGLRAVAWERFAGVTVQLVLTVGVLLALPSPVHSLVPLLAITVATAAFGVVLVARARADGARSVWTRVRSALGGDIRLARRSWAGIALLSALSVVGHAAVFVLAARTAGTTAPLLKLFPIAVIVLWAGVLPSIGGWGPREGVTAWAFGAAGLGAGLGLATAVAYGVMILVACLPGAAVLVVASFRDTRRTRQRKLALREGAARA